MIEANWSFWRSFLAVCETGSLSRAAQHLRVSQPTIGRHIQSLETAIGRPLFVRSQSGFQATSLAISMLPAARAMSDAAMTLERRVTANEVERAGTVRLSASEIVGVEVLPDILARFRADYPAIIIELILNNRQEDLLTRRADIAIRMAEPIQERLVRKHLGNASLGLYAHHNYLAACGCPKQLDDLTAHDLIGVDRDLARLQAYRPFSRAMAASDFTFRCDSDLGQLAALRAGLGIGVCQSIIADKNADLIRILPSDIGFDLPVWLVRHEDLKHDPIVGLTYQFIAKALTQTYDTQT